MVKGLAERLAGYGYGNTAPPTPIPKPQTPFVTDPNFSNLGPLAAFAGIWEGDKGKDESPDDDRVTIENNAFRERVALEPIGLVENHEQSLYGLRYAKSSSSPSTRTARSATQKTPSSRSRARKRSSTTRTRTRCVGWSRAPATPGR